MPNHFDPSIGGHGTRRNPSRADRQPQGAFTPLMRQIAHLTKRGRDDEALLDIVGEVRHAPIERADQVVNALDALAYYYPNGSQASSAFRGVAHLGQGILNQRRMGMRYTRESNPRRRNIDPASAVVDGLVGGVAYGLTTEVVRRYMGRKANSGKKILKRDVDQAEREWASASMRYGENNYATVEALARYREIKAAYEVQRQGRSAPLAARVKAAGVARGLPWSLQGKTISINTSTSRTDPRRRTGVVVGFSNSPHGTYVNVETTTGGSLSFVWDEADLARSDFRIEGEAKANPRRQNASTHRIVTDASGKAHLVPGLASRIPGQPRLALCGQPVEGAKVQTQSYCRACFDVHTDPRGRMGNPGMAPLMLVGNRPTLADAAESWASRRGMRVPARGSAAWQGMFAAWQRGGMRENPGDESYRMLLREAKAQSDPNTLRQAWNEIVRSGRSKNRAVVAEFNRVAEAVAVAIGKERRATETSECRKLHDEFEPVLWGMRAAGQPVSMRGLVSVPGFNEEARALEDRIMRTHGDAHVSAVNFMRKTDWATMGMPHQSPQEMAVIMLRRFDGFEPANRAAERILRAVRRKRGEDSVYEYWRQVWNETARPENLRELGPRRRNSPTAALMLVGNGSGRVLGTRPMPPRRRNDATQAQPRFDLRLPADRVKGKVSLEEARRRYGDRIDFAKSAIRDFHGRDVTIAPDVTLYDDGKKEVTVAWMCGRSPEVTYGGRPEDVLPGSVKDEALWVHTTNEEGEKGKGPDRPTYLIGLVPEKGRDTSRPVTKDFMLIGHMKAEKGWLDK